VLVVLAVTGVDLMDGRQIGNVSWAMALALVVLVLGRELFGLMAGPTVGGDANDGRGSHDWRARKRALGAMLARRGET
jgi:hypothetical protein